MKLWQAVKNNAFIRRQEGNLLIEAALLFPIMLTSFLGIVALGQYMDARERLTQTVNQVANALSIARDDNPAERAKLLAMMRWTANPHDPFISVQYCGISEPTGLNPTIPVPPSPNISGQTGTGRCGYGAWATGSTAAAACPALPAEQGYDQFVVVDASCNYYPQFNFLGLFTNNPMTSSISVPLRWDFLSIP